MTDDQPLTMVREDLENIPLYPLPAGYSFRWYQAGDEEHWIALQAPFYAPGAINLDLFRAQFGCAAGLLAERQCYLLNQAGDAIGTATAWIYDGFRGPEYGRIHWVVVAQPYQGQGLSRSLLGLACQRLRELGHTKAYLTTSWLRLVAVNLYRRFGFVELPDARR